MCVEKDRGVGKNKDRGGGWNINGVRDIKDSGGRKEVKKNMRL
jgi:hypothetical protein